MLFLKEVPRNSSNDQVSYEYVIDKKREEILLDRLEQLQQTIKKVQKDIILKDILKNMNNS